MKTQDFQNLLFKSAVTAIACDGNISESEISAIQIMATDEIYFLDYKIDEPLQSNIANIKTNGKNAINQYLNELASADLTERQELLLVEVILRMIEADNEVKENEIKFLQMVKAKLKVSEETLIVKFARQIEYLVDANNFGANTAFDSDIKIQ
jgi:uncharacterized tellurite resistance protein B-like protein